MKIDVVRILGVVVVAVAGAVAVVGCRQKSDSEPSKTAGVAERAGAALDKAAEKTVEAATNVAGKPRGRKNNGDGDKGRCRPGGREDRQSPGESRRRRREDWCGHAEVDTTSR